MFTNNKKIAFVATGDELVYGDILNTNGQRMSQLLREEGFDLGMHFIVSDDECEIARALKFALEHYDIVLLTGGLGPTSDDRTRFALANVLNSTLELHEASWQHVQERLTKVKLEIGSYNQQQALFPKSAVVLNNPNGTANGCYILQNEKWIFMLPGPPSECLPMFQKEVLPLLKQYVLTQPLYHHRWRLFGVPEGQIAHQLDSLLRDFSIQTSYRWDYPYLDFKIRSYNAADIKEAIPLVDEATDFCRICNENEVALDNLLMALVNKNYCIFIEDNVSSGELEYWFKRTNYGEQFIFNAWPNSFLPEQIGVKISGLTCLRKKDVLPGTDQVSICIFSDKDIKTYEKDVLVRNQDILMWVREWASYLILKSLNFKSF